MSTATDVFLDEVGVGRPGVTWAMVDGFVIAAWPSSGEYDTLFVRCYLGGENPPSFEDALSSMHHEIQRYPLSLQ